ncbi:MAG: hypothetical protein WD448_12150 [Woeseia sp.]
MRNLLLLLLLANILYFLWEWTTEKPPETGVAIIDPSTLGPPLELADEGQSVSGGAAVSSFRQINLEPVVGRSCVSIGPFTGSPDAQRVVQDFQAEGVQAAVRSTAGELFVGHWVQIRDVPDRQTGNAMVERLIEGGLTDAYLVPTEDEGLKVSLGLFGEMSRAERVELQAESLDLPAEIAPRMRDATVFYVDIALPRGRGAGSMMEQFGEDKVLLRAQATCPVPL